MQRRQNYLLRMWIVKNNNTPRKQKELLGVFLECIGNSKIPRSKGWGKKLYSYGGNFGG
jgi:hypothetical protein